MACLFLVKLIKISIGMQSELFGMDVYISSISYLSFSDPVITTMLNRTAHVHDVTE